MIRSDFVSNSSSSSFVVSASDNQYDCILREYDVLNLKQYLDHYFKYDCFGYMLYNDYNVNNFTFVLDSIYCARFTHGLYRTLPNGCKRDLKIYLDALNNKPELAYDLEKNMEWSKGIDKILERIKDKVYESLEYKWGDEKFHCACVNDNFIDKERDDGICTEEELITERMDYISSLKPLKFKRVFSHH